MYSKNHFYPFLISCFAFIVGISGIVFAAPEPEVQAEGQRPMIGTMYISYRGAFFYEGREIEIYDPSFRIISNEIAENRGYGIRERIWGVNPQRFNTSFQNMLERGLEAAVIHIHEPIDPSIPVGMAHDYGIPIVLHGLRPQVPVSAPFVGEDLETTGKMLANAITEQFKEKFPNETPRIMGLSYADIERDQIIREAFFNEFQKSYPDAEIISQPNVQGSVTDVQQIIQSRLNVYQDINIFVATSDYFGERIINVLKGIGRGEGESEIVAAIGGKRRAMEYLLDENSWTIEIGVNVREQVVKTFDLIEEMLDGERSLTNEEEFLYKPFVFTEDSSVSSINTYLEQNHGATGF